MAQANKKQHKVKETEVKGKKILTISGSKDRAIEAFNAAIDAAGNSVAATKEAAKAGFAAALNELGVG